MLKAYEICVTRGEWNLLANNIHRKKIDINNGPLVTRVPANLFPYEYPKRHPFLPYTRRLPEPLSSDSGGRCMTGTLRHCSHDLHADLHSRVGHISGECYAWICALARSHLCHSLNSIVNSLLWGDIAFRVASGFVRMKWDFENLPVEHM